MKKHFIRIKINKKIILSIVQSGHSDYIIFSPNLTPDKNNFASFHYTFHTLNNRYHSKITNLKDAKKNFEEMKKEAQKSGFKVTCRDIESFRKNFNDEDLKTKAVGLLRFVYLDKKDDFLNKSFSNSKTRDEEFKKLIEVEIPQKFNSVEIRIFVNKNIKKDEVLKMIKKGGKDFHKKYLVEDILNDNNYIFTIMIKYDQLKTLNKFKNRTRKEFKTK